MILNFHVVYIFCHTQMHFELYHFGSSFRCGYPLSSLELLQVSKDTHSCPHRNSTSRAVAEVVFGYGGFHGHGGTPKWTVYMGKPIYTWMIWGYRYFGKLPYGCTAISGTELTLLENPQRRYLKMLSPCFLIEMPGPTFSQGSHGIPMPGPKKPGDDHRQLAAWQRMCRNVSTSLPWWSCLVSFARALVNVPNPSKGGLSKGFLPSQLKASYGSSKTYRSEAARCNQSLQPVLCCAFLG